MDAVDQLTALSQEDGKALVAAQGLVGELLKGLYFQLGDAHQQLLQILRVLEVCDQFALEFDSLIDEGAQTLLLLVNLGLESSLLATIEPVLNSLSALNELRKAAAVLNPR